MPLLRALGIDVDHWPGYLRYAHHFVNAGLAVYMIMCCTQLGQIAPSVRATLHHHRALRLVVLSFSNLVFELWERPSEAAGAAPRHFVRVLYNREVLHFPGTAEGTMIRSADLWLASLTKHGCCADAHSRHMDSWTLPFTLADGTIELSSLFGGHALDAAQHKDLCKVKLEHDGSMPKAAESGDAVQGL
jgi:hypothetical protein